LIGYFEDGILTNSYSIGNVIGNNDVGGFVGGSNPSGISNNSYWDINTSGQTLSGGQGEGRTTAEMKTQSTFIDWDFENIWDIQENVTYPYFIYQGIEIPFVPIPIPSTRTATGQAIYEVLDSSGAGLGLFFQFLGIALPILLFGLVFVGIIVAIAYSIKNVLIEAGNP
jgi:hypothetical protein